MQTLIPPDGAHIPNGELKSPTSQSPDVGFIKMITLLSPDGGQGLDHGAVRHGDDRIRGRIKINLVHTAGVDQADAHRLLTDIHVVGLGRDGAVGRRAVCVQLLRTEKLSTACKEL